MSGSAKRLTGFSFPRLALPPIQPERVDLLRGVIYDKLRRRVVALTAEEWVRQCFVEWMTTELGYPVPLMANETGIEMNGMRRRCDSVVYSRCGLTPLAIIEYKRPTVSLTQRVFDQIARYNTVLQVPCLIVSNGLKHYCCLRGKGFVEEIPSYERLVEISENLRRP